MLRRLLIWVVLFLVFVVVLAPATCWDSIVRRVSHDNFALLAPEGNLWHGTAQLAVRDPSSGSLRPLMPMAWNINGRALFRGVMLWDFSIAGSPPFTLGASFEGAAVRALRLDLPARFALERIPNAIGRLGWHGDLRVVSPTLRCSWRGICNGSVSADWMGAAVDIFPGRHLGDYKLAATATDGTIDFIMTTGSGEVPISAQGKFMPGGKVAVSGKLSGDPAFTDRLPNIARGWVQRTETRGAFTFNYAN
ncbi:MAG: type II secretion system protein N [Rhodocyclaceae bacterium]